MNVLIVEDERPAARRLIQLLEAYNSNIEIIDVLEECTQVIQTIQSRKIDLLFLDIHLSDGYSTSIFDQIDARLPVIFTTAYDKYALESYKTRSIDYLLKPIDKKRLYQALKKFEQLQPNHQTEAEAITFKSRILIKSGKKLIPLPTSEIAYIFSEKSQSIIVNQAQQQFLTHHTIDYFEKYLDSSFFYRINRKCICNINQIESLQSNSNQTLSFETSDHNLWNVSRERVADFKKWLNK